MGAKNGKVLVNLYWEDKDRGFFQQASRWAHSAQSKLKGGGEMWLPCALVGWSWHCCAWGITATGGAGGMKAGGLSFNSLMRSKDYTEGENQLWQKSLNVKRTIWGKRSYTFLWPPLHSWLFTNWVKVSVPDRTTPGTVVQLRSRMELGSGKGNQEAINCETCWECWIYTDNKLAECTIEWRPGEEISDNQWWFSSQTSVNMISSREIENLGGGDECEEKGLNWWK